MARMKELLTIGTALLLACSSPLLGQDATNGLKVQPDKNNVLANSLVGSWVADSDLNKRLGKRGKHADLQFASDASVLAGVPAKIAKKLSTFRIYLAGTMTRGDTKHAFLVTELAGNATIFWFAARNGDPMGNAETWNASLVRAEAEQADLMFLGGDFNNQSFTAYKRAGKVVGKLSAEAALADIARLLSAGETREFVATYVAPEDLAKLKERGRDVDQLARRFEGERGEMMLKALTIAGKSKPQMSKDGAVATWEINQERMPARLRLQLIDGRWFLRNN